MIGSLWFRAYYLFLVILVITCQLYFPESLAHTISKSLLMSSLLLALLVDTRSYSTILKWSTVLAVLLSLAGDILLLPTVDNFLFGLLSFLLVHVVYIFCFLRLDSRPLAVPFIRRHPWSIFLMILFGGWMFLQLRNGAGELAWAILIYIIAIAVMTLTAFNREAGVGKSSYRYVAWGALFFVISDSVLAWDRFAHSVDSSSLWIIGTYGIAQLLIVTGLVKQIQERNQAAAPEAAIN